jgi:hypothetical protein
VNHGNLFYLSDLRTESIVTCLSTIMGPYALPSFKETLLSACDEYMITNDGGSNKSRSQVITQVAKDIADIVESKENEKVLDDLEKVGHVFNWHTWEITNHISSVSRHGLVITHLAIP